MNPNAIGLNLVANLKSKKMKTIMGAMMLAGFALVASTGADAQRRGRDSGGGGGRESNVSGRSSRSFSEGRTFSSPSSSRQYNTIRPNTSFRQNNSYRQNTFTPVQRNERAFNTTAVQRGRSYSYPQREAYTRNTVRMNNNVFDRGRTTATSLPYGRNAYGRGFGGNRYTNYSYHYNNRYYGGGYYFYNDRRYSFMYGHRYAVIPRSFLSINFGGFNYYYNAGLYWGYFGGYYQPIFPPFGLQIGVLPYGYYSFYWGGLPYYYYDGIYYRYYDDYYQVVDAPVGATVYSLPEGVRTVVINGETMYELNGTYYKQSVDNNGRTMYTVIGKYGVVNNTDDNGVTTSPDNTTPDNTVPDNNGYNDNGSGDQGQVAPANPQTSEPTLQMGDEVSELPDGSKAVVINGEQLYVTPDNVYLKEINEKGVTKYTVIGK